MDPGDGQFRRIVHHRWFRCCRCHATYCYRPCDSGDPLKGRSRQRQDALFRGVLPYCRPASDAMLGLTLHPWWLQQEAGRPLDISSLHFSFDQTTPTWQGAALNGSTQKGVALPVALHPAPSYVRWPRSIMLATRTEEIVSVSLF